MLFFRHLGVLDYQYQVRHVNMLVVSQEEIDLAVICINPLDTKEGEVRPSIQIYTRNYLHMPKWKVGTNEDIETAAPL